MSLSDRVNLSLGNRHHVGPRTVLGGQQWGTVLNQFRVKDNARGQFQIRMTTEDGTITCVVSPHLEAGLLAQRRDTALRRAKRLAQQLDEAIKLPGAGPVTLRGHHPAANTPVQD